MSDLTRSLSEFCINGRSNLFNSASFTYKLKLHNAELSIADEIKEPCGSGNDTLIGQITLSISQVRTLLLTSEQRDVGLECLYRIVLKDNSYNIKFRGFKITQVKTSWFGMKSEIKTQKIEDLYNLESSWLFGRSDRLLWSDLKLLMDTFHFELEQNMSQQDSDFNFDD